MLAVLLILEIRLPPLPPDLDFGPSISNSDRPLPPDLHFGSN